MVEKGKVVGRILILYLSVLIPMLLCSVLMAKSSFRQSEQQEEQRMKIMLQDIVSELNSWSIDFQNQSSSLGEMWEISPTQVLTSTENAKQAIRQLNHARLFDGRTEDIVVYYGVGKLYTSQGIVNKKTYFDSSLNCMKESTDRGLAALAATSRSVMLLRTNNNSDLLIWHVPIRKYTTNYRFSANYIVSFERVVEVFENHAAYNQMMFRVTVGEENAYVRVVDGRGDVLEPDLFNMWQKSGDMVCLSQDFADMEVTLFYDPQVSQTQFQSFQAMNIFLLILGMLLSTIVSVVFSYHRWGRIKSLTDKWLIAPYEDQKKKVFRDEFDYIQIMLEQSERENVQVIQNTQMYRHGMIRQVAKVIFHGLVIKVDAIHPILHSCGLELCEEYFYLCGVVLENNTDIRKLERLFDDCLYCEDVVNGKMVLLFMVESSTTDHDCKERLEMADKILNDMLSIGVKCSCFALSQVYGSLSLINYAYLEVISLMEKPVHSEDLIVCGDMHLRSRSEHLTKLQSEQLEHFIEALEKKNLDKAQETLANMLMEPSQNGSQNQYYMRYCIRQSMVLAVRGENFEENSGLMAKIMSINPMDEMNFYERILKILQSICESNKSREQLDEAVLYVKENYHRYDLSLEEVSVQVGMSKTQISKLFKAQLGINYLDFLTQLRMDKARELLLNTDETVKNILMSVGYIDKTSFTKKFKAYYGMSPTEYRGSNKMEN